MSTKLVARAAPKYLNCVAVGKWPIIGKGLADFTPRAAARNCSTTEADWYDSLTLAMPVSPASGEATTVGISAISREFLPLKTLPNFSFIAPIPFNFQ
ncbi:MAG: hypothetical protein ABL985_12165 [Casimicrobium sp.]